MTAHTEDHQDPAPLRMPAEWEPHAATYLAWPHNSQDWPGKFHAIPWVFGEIIRHLVLGDPVKLLVASEAMRARVEKLLIRIGVNLSAVTFLPFETDRGWMRDCAPAFVHDAGGAVAAVEFQFNGWAKYGNWRRDAQVAPYVAQHAGITARKAMWQDRQVVLEGGAIDVNGRGTLLTTEECLLDPEIQVRNPGMTREDYEALFHQYLGITNTIWLDRGIAGDDTHGHVDDLCRFVSSDTVVLCHEDDPDDVNYLPLQQNAERLANARLEDGSRLDVIRLPMPAPLYFDGVRLPASYANFFIGNEAVLVPTFNDPRDRLALDILAELFQDRVVVGIHAVDLVWGFGTIHCLTHEEPAPRVTD
jgi:agmatine deiminase